MALPLVLTACASPEAAPLRSPWVTRAGVTAHGYAPPGANLPPPAAAALVPVELGAVPYDGITLPLGSPDARFVATQSGGLPDWDVLLAAPGAAAAAALRNTVEIHALPATGRPLARLPAGFRSAGPRSSRASWSSAWPDGRPRRRPAPWVARGPPIVFLTPMPARRRRSTSGELAFVARAGRWPVRASVPMPDAYGASAMPGRIVALPGVRGRQPARSTRSPCPTRGARLLLLLVRIDLRCRPAIECVCGRADAEPGLLSLSVRRLGAVALARALARNSERPRRSAAVLARRADHRVGAPRPRRHAARPRRPPGPVRLHLGRRCRRARPVHRFVHRGRPCRADDRRRHHGRTDVLRTATSDTSGNIDPPANRDGRDAVHPFAHERPGGGKIFVPDRPAFAHSIRCLG